MFSFSLLNLDSWAGLPLTSFESSLLALPAFLVAPFGASFLDEFEMDESRFSGFLPLVLDLVYYLRMILFEVAIDDYLPLPNPVCAG